MDEHELAALRARWAAASPGPWEAVAEAAPFWMAIVHPVTAREAYPPGYEGRPVFAEVSTKNPADPVAVAAAPTDIAALLAALEAVTAERDRYRAALYDVVDAIQFEGETFPYNAGYNNCVDKALALLGPLAPPLPGGLTAPSDIE